LVKPSPRAPSPSTKPTSHATCDSVAFT
jgi:hypothetical protein